MKYFFVYIVRCADKSLYTGSTSNLPKRIKRHNSGEGANYTKTRLPVKLIYFEKVLTRKEAVKREKQIKRWSRIKKENMIKYGHPNPNKTKKT